MEYHVTSLILQLQPDQRDSVLQYLHSIEGAEVHAESIDGQLVITLEGEGHHPGIESLHTIPGVLSVSLVSHHIEPLK
ncbi:chaperone NapD [Ferrimonas lipolytica]|uniref:Chaperone NapD n=1 Tax=Ferrimonas lipolytica TaxID=2724191 RepID=A0A6H1UCX0_9GAMM|nr:chaperone NapD [Ferrimonas lipolytica]QIZ76479.1 chaperone NapD [Ferrimonas lipolytica]